MNNSTYFFISRKYKVFLINEILPGCNSDCRNVLAIPIEKIPEHFTGNLISYLNDYKYRIISHTLNRCSTTYYKNYELASFAYNFLENGSLATILVDNDDNIIAKNGETNIVVLCINEISNKRDYENILIELN